MSSHWWSTFKLYLCTQRVWKSISHKQCFFFPKACPSTVVKSGQPSLSHHADVPLDKTISGLKRGIPKPGSCFDEAILFLIWWCASGCYHFQRWNSSSSQDFEQRPWGFYAKSDWDPELFIIPIHPYYTNVPAKEIQPSKPGLELFWFHHPNIFLLTCLSIWPSRLVFFADWSLNLAVANNTLGYG